MSLRDAHGNAVSTEERAALEASERALWRMLSFYGTPIDDLAVAAAADPDWALPHAMQAGFLFGLTEPALGADGRAALAAAEQRSAHANDRERAHLAALRRLADGDWAGAGACWQALGLDHPRDALALQWGHLFDFYRGDAPALLQRVETALPAWAADDPLRPYVLGMQAFGLEESHRYAEAEVVGRQALAGPARVPWAIHAVAHVMEMQGRHDAGQAWMAEWRPHWAEGNGFATHLGWHEALFALERLDHAGALAVFDTYLGAGGHEITLQRLDAASLLWRIALQGGDVGDRWRELLSGWPLAVADGGQSTFNDAHAVLALLGAGDIAHARAWVAAATRNAASASGWNHAVMRDIGAPLLNGLLAFGDGRDRLAVDTLAAVRPHLARFGGSHAQRDVLDQTLLAACARGGETAVGRALLVERAVAKPTTPLTAYWQRRLRKSSVAF